MIILIIFESFDLKFCEIQEIGTSVLQLVLSEL